MAPKKKPPKQTDKKPTSASSSKPGKVSSSGPRLQISAENESRLRRLLLNSGRSAQPEPDAGDKQDVLSRSQKAKRLKAVYEKLSCEGFTNEQIELALSALKDGATFEAALDWLCLNLPGNELPLKFSSGTSRTDTGGSVGVISVAREDWMPSVNPSFRVQENAVEFSVKPKEQLDEDTLDQCQPSQAEWIKKYLIQQEEEESKTWEEETLDWSLVEQVKTPRPYDIVAKAYLDARSNAARAKEKGDKKGQQEASNIIRELKQELLALGLTDEALASEFSHERLHVSVEDSMPSDVCESMPFASGKCTSTSPLCLEGSDVATDKESSVSNELCSGSVLSNEPIFGEDGAEDVELGGFFSEDTSCADAIRPEVLELQKKEKIRELCSEKNLQKLDGIWKKGDPKKIPKAILHQLCQRSSWEAPKFNKIVMKGSGFSYSVSVLRKASGRGKGRKAGGLTTIQLPDQLGTFESAEDAQNRVAAFALCQLFPEIPVHLLMMEPYASLILQWKAGESLTNIDYGEEIRRTSFVDVLLKTDGSKASNDISDGSSQVLKNLSAEVIKLEKESPSKEAESSFLKQELQNKRKTQKYQEMSNTRAALPIVALKGDVLQLLQENNVLVVCGETGSGKTTQVPQFILDDMIESGQGGYCNIICTQPRRIAAISVAERVAEERCEGSPGSSGSLVGYQVRLDSARCEKTKLLFCTTGILLRKLAGDRSLTGITHIIVDEVHERSLLGDFLLIVLKNFIEKQPAHGKSSLKVILMSATVDSVLFSRYFGNCPVITAQGRTHPVTAYYLEDIYESVNYCLASDSPACLGEVTSTREMRGPVNNNRGKKNLVLSSWGDESLLSEEYVNPYYDSSEYESYSDQTKQNLKKLNEEVIDYDLLEDLVSHVDETCDSGAILIFLPGVSEIYMLLDRLTSSYRFGGQSSDWLLPLHSSIAPTDQKKVFLRPPENTRKVIVATNIAETSITIDDVVYVIDCGKHKENRYNPQKKLTSMVEDWISRANARQRSGRAGRVKPGICFCLYTRHRFEKKMRPYQVPEMLRMPLVELCLQIKLLGLGSIKPFLLKALEPPKEEAMTSAISLLYEVGAIEGNEELTPLGHHLAKLPVDVLIGKMIIYGGIFGCLSPILSISAFLSYKSPFIYPKDEKQDVERAKLLLLTEKSVDPFKESIVDKQSDHLVMMVAYRKWEKILREQGAKAAQQFCKFYFLSSSVMHMIRQNSTVFSAAVKAKLILHVPRLTLSNSSPLDYMVFLLRDMRIQFGTLLADIGFISFPKTYQVNGRKKDSMDIWLSDNSKPFNMHANNSAIVKAILCAGLYPNVAANEQGVTEAALSRIQQSSGSSKKGHVVWYDGRREVHMHPSSVIHNLKGFQHPFLVFLEKVETNKVFLRDTTVVSPFSILLFGGSINIQHQSGSVIIDGWLKLAAPAQTAVLFKELRSALHSLLRELIRKPANAGIADNEVTKSMIHLLLEEDKAAN